MFALLAAAILGSSVIGGLFGMANKPKMPTPPVTPDVNDAQADSLSRRQMRQRASDLGRGSTFLSGGVSDLGTVRRGSDALNPFGAR